MDAQLFRKVALDRLSSPEQLDQIITITTPKGWLALLAIAGILATAITWGFLGSIPTKVQGQSILLNKGGVISILAQTSGTISKLSIDVDTQIEKDDIIARIEQDDLLVQIQQAQSELKNLEAKFEEKNKGREGALFIQLRQLNQEQINQRQNITNLENQISAQQEILKQKEEFAEGLRSLFKKGIISKTKVLEGENEVIAINQQINSLTLEIEKVKNELNSIQLQVKQLESTKSSESLDQFQSIETTRDNIALLQKRFADYSQVISPYSGRVLEVPVKIGSLVQPGTPLVLIENRSNESGLEAVMYFSPLTGKQIQKGMQVRISPSIVKREEFGFMEGIVIEVDRFPSTIQTVLKTLQNESLARMLTSNSPPIKVRADLFRDANSVSGYKWSSRNGPPIEIHSGTICSVEVTVREQAPITLVIPILKKFLFGEDPLLNKPGQS